MSDTFDVKLLIQNREVLMILTTSIAILIGCVFDFVRRRSSGSKSSKVEQPKPLIVKDLESKVDASTKKVSIFFGTQTGITEGFTKVIPAENIVAAFQASQKTIFAISKTPEEAQIFLEGQCIPM